MDREQVSLLIDKYLNGVATPEEEYVLLRWYAAKADADDVKQPLDRDIDRLREQMLLELKSRHSPKRVRLPYLAAASLAMILSIGLTVHFASQSARKDVAVKEIGPGGNRAILTLSDGQTINLSEQQEGIVVARDITYLDGSKLYEDDGSGNTNSQTSGFLELYTPKGGTYSITLEDGTRVWLNSGSRLRYPARFSDTERHVFLEGEAYFDVSKRRGPAGLPNGALLGGWPFRVEVKGQLVEVLGTEFNIEAYGDRGGTRTTLVSGKVKLTNNQETVTLLPGYQADQVGTGFSVRKVDVLEYVAWKDGYFYFNDSDLDHALRQFARWYDVEVSPIPKKNNDLFSGKIRRSMPLKDALDLLEEISGRTISIEENSITVR